MKKFIMTLAIIALIIPAFSQDETKDQEKKHDQDQVSQLIYAEEVIEDFESSSYTREKNLKFDVTTQQEADLAIRDQYPAQYNNSKKYLGVQVFGKIGDVFRIKPEKPFEIKKYCKEINVWVYGKNFAGELQFVVQDIDGTVSNISFGRLNFSGWKKLTASVGKKIKQQDLYLENDMSFKILYIVYKPANDTDIPIWQYFYLDDITVTVRDKYKDTQSDAWGKRVEKDKKKEGDQ